MENVQLEHDSHNAAQKKYPLCILAHDMESPENIGSIFRIADSLGLEKIFLSGSSPIPPNPKIKKTSRSTEKHVPFEYFKNPTKVLTRLKDLDYKIISLEITSSSLDIRNLKITPDEKICLIVGSENYGVDQSLLDVSDECVHITMMGMNSSMNVAVACGIACWEILRGR